MTDWDWTRVVVDHVHIRVRDAGASVAFYKAALEPLGIPALWERENGAQLANLVVTDGEPTTSGAPYTSHSSRTPATRSTRSIARVSRWAAGTTALRGSASSTAPRRAGATTLRSCSTRTATSRPSAASSRSARRGSSP